ncbi:MAG: putative collagen-binding domain-containing protein [Bacteroidota bacterium]
MLSRPFLTRIPDQSMVVKTQEYSEDYISATRDESGSYAMIYFPTGQATFLDLTSLDGNKLEAHWYDPRSGANWKAERLKKGNNVRVTPPSSGKGNDWVLMIDAKKTNFPVPGQAILSNMRY